MFDADADGSKGDGREEVSGELVVARGDAAQVLHFVEEALDQVALTVAFEIDAADHPDIALAGNMGGGSHRSEQLDDAAGAVAAVGDRLAGRAQALDQARQGGLVGGLAGRQQQANRQAYSIDDGVDLGRQSPTRTADGVIRAPLFPPAAC
jgi:hypothetical protein